MKGIEERLVIRMGKAPQSENAIRGLMVYRGEDYPLVYDRHDKCIGIVFEHDEARKSPANGQAEICFFDDFYDEYGKWHRMFSIGYKGKERIEYAIFKMDLDRIGEYRYIAAIRNNNDE